MKKTLLAIVSLFFFLTLNSLVAQGQAPSLTYPGPQSYTAGTAITTLAPVNTGGAVPGYFTGQTTTLPASYVSSGARIGVVTDAAGNTYVADPNYDYIAKVSPSGVISKFAGNGTTGSANGTGTAATFNQPAGLAIDAAGNLYVADYGNNMIRKIDPYGVVTTLAGSVSPGNTNGTGTAASFNGPVGLALDVVGNVYVADLNNDMVRKITPAGVVSTLAGSGSPGYADGTGTATVFNLPCGVSLDASGNVYVSDYNNNLIRKITPAGVVTTLAGNGTAGFANGTGNAAIFNQPTSLVVDAFGNIYVTDEGNYLIRKVTAAGVVSTFAGSGTSASIDGIGTAASFTTLAGGISIDASGILHIGDSRNVRMVATVGYSFTPALPAGLYFDATSGNITGTPLLAAAGANYAITGANSAGSSTAIVLITVTGAISVAPPATAAPAITYSSPHSYTAGTAITALSPTNTGGAVPPVLYGQTSTLATGLNTIAGTAVDASGNLYVATASNIIQKVSPGGTVSIFAGTGTAGAANGTGTAASFNNPQGLAIDANGNMYVADLGNNLIRKVSPAGVVTTLAGSGIAGRNDGTGTAASFNGPTGIAADNFGNVYVADQGNQLIRRISPSGVVTTLAGSGSPAYLDGVGTAASFYNPTGIAVDGSGNVYVADQANNYIRKITPAGVVSTLAGNGSGSFANGTGSAAGFNNPRFLVLDPAGNVYVTDLYNYMVRKITPAGVVTTLAGSGASTTTDGTGAQAAFGYTQGIAIDATGNLYVGDGGNVRKVSAGGYSVSPALPPGLYLDATTGNISGTPLVATSAATYTVSAYNIGGSSTASLSLTVTGAITVTPPATAAPVISYQTPQSYTAGTAITTLMPANTGGAVPAALYGQTTTLAGGFGNLQGIVTDASGNVYVADISANVIRKILPGGVSIVFAGSGGAGESNGTGTAASFNSPGGLAIDASGNLYVADSGNDLIREISPAGVVTTFAGSGIAGRDDGTGSAASFNYPRALAVDNFGNVYVADQNNGLIRRISAAGVVTTLAGSGSGGYADGTGSAASFNSVTGIAVDGLGNVYVADTNNEVIRKITPTGVVTTIVGTAGSGGSSNGTGTAASFNAPNFLVLDASGNIYVTDYNNNLIRKITPAAVVTTLAGGGQYANGTGTAAGFSSPEGIAIDGSGNLYICESGDVRKVSSVGYNVNPALPAGLSLDATTGSIGGTPLLAATAANYTISAYNTGGTGSAVVNITVTGVIIPTSPIAAPVISYQSPQGYTAGTAITTLTPTNTGGAVPGVLYGQTTTFASGFGQIFGTAVDAAGNVYAADFNNSVIWKITPAGQAGIFAGTYQTSGSANGTGTAASFNQPVGLAIDASGNLYVGDFGNNLIRKITPAGVVSTFAGSGVSGRDDGTGTAASFNQPQEVAVDNFGNVYVADASNNLIRRISPGGVVSTLAGSGSGAFADGTGSAASFNSPTGVAVDRSGNVYVADNQNQLIRKITPGGVVTTLAGTAGSAGAANGTGTAASFNYPNSLIVDASGNIYVADDNNGLIRKISPGGVVSTFAGGGPGFNGIGTVASFNSIRGLTVDASGNLYAGENGDVRKVLATGYSVSQALPPGLVLDATTGNISGTPLFATAATNYTINAYNAGGSGAAVLKVTVTGTLPAPAAISAPVISYATPQTYTSGTAITTLSPSNTGGAVPATIYGQTTTFAGSGATGRNDGTGTVASFNMPAGAATDAYGNVYIADANNNVIRKISPTGVVSTLAGSGSGGYADGTGTAASFNGPAGIAVDASGNVYVADYNNQVIRKISPAGVVSTFAGTAGTAGYADGTGTAAQFNAPVGVAVDASKNVYVADSHNELIRKITSAGVVTTLAGTAGTSGSANGAGTAASFNYPNGIAVNAAGVLYVADYGNQLIRMITSAGVVTTLAGSGGTGSNDGAGTAASFSSPALVTVDKTGNVYVADEGNNLVRRITPAGLVSTVAGIATANNGINNSTSFNEGIAIDGSGNLYVSDQNNNVISKITVTGYTTDNALPAGLSLNGTTGTISGTPTSPIAATNYTITAYNGGGGSAAVVNITVTGTPVTAAPVTAPAISYTTPQSYPAGTTITPLAPANAGGAVPANAYGQPSTFTGSAGYAHGMVTDAYGNVYYVYNNDVYKATPAGVITVLAGNGNSGEANGKGSAATFNGPSSIAIDASGNLYVADSGNDLIRKVSPTGVVTTFAGSGTQGSGNGTGTAASFNNPQGLTVDASGNIYVADYGNDLIRKITPAAVVSTLAGSGAPGYSDGSGVAANFNNPLELTVDGSGNLYVSDQGNYVVRKITAAGLVSTVAGSAGNSGDVNGTGTAATFGTLWGIAVDPLGNLYVADNNNGQVREITQAGVVTTFYGLGSYGGGAYSTAFNPVCLTIDASDNLYVQYSTYQAITKIPLTGYTLNGTLPNGLVFDPTTGIISGTPLLAAAASNYTVTGYNAGGSSTTAVSIAVTGAITNPNPVSPPNISYATPQSYPAGTAITPLKPSNSGGAVPASVYGQAAPFAGLQLNGSSGVVVDAAGNVYISGQNKISKITPAGVLATFAGSSTAGFVNGTGTAAQFNNPQGLAIDASGNIYVVDRNNNAIRKITPSGLVTTLAGNGSAGNLNGPGASANFNSPQGIAVDENGYLYVADYNNGMIRKISPSGLVSTLAGNGATSEIGAQINADGTGSSASFDGPAGVTLDAYDNVYVAETGAFNGPGFSDLGEVRKVTPAGVVTTIVQGSTSFAGDLFAIAIDALGNIYVADNTKSVIDKIDPSLNITTLVGSTNLTNPSGLTLDASGNLYAVGNFGSVLEVSLSGYALGSPLPPGLTFDGTTGTISGTPTLATAAANYTVTAYNTGGSSTATVNIAVTGAITPPVNPVSAPVISYATPQSYTAGVGIAPLVPANSGGAVPATIYGQTVAFEYLSYGVGMLVADAAGNVYTFNPYNQLIKTTPAGVQSVFAGSGAVGAADGPALTASFNYPNGLAIDAAGNIYVTDARNNKIRKITAAGVVSTLAGNGSAGQANGPGADASFSNPTGIAVDNYGNVYVTDASGGDSYNSSVIREISPSGFVSTLAGGPSGYADGTGTAASFFNPIGIAVDGSGNVYVADNGNSVIRKITQAGVVTTFAGTYNTTGFVNGTGVAASFNNPQGLAIDPAGNLYVADLYNNSIRRITPSGVVTTLAGGNYGTANGIGSSVAFSYPDAVATDAAGNLYVGEVNNAGIRKIYATGYSPITPSLPPGLAFDATTGIITGTPTLATSAATYTVTAYNAGGNSTTTLSVAVTGAITPPVNPVTPPNISYATPQSYTAGNAITALKPTNTGGAVPAAIYGETSTYAYWSYIYNLASDASGNLYYVYNNGNQVFKITSAGVQSLYAGNGSSGFTNGPATAASFSNLQGLTVDAAGNVYVADEGNNAIRKISAAGVVTTLAGTGVAGNVNGPAALASFNGPVAVAVDNLGNVYVTDQNNYEIREISPLGEVSTLAGGSYGFANGTGTAASFSTMYGIAVDGLDNVYVADQGNQVIRKITQGGVVSTFAGTQGANGAVNGTGTAASFTNPQGLTIDGAGNLYVADLGNSLVRKITPAAVVTTLAGDGAPSGDPDPINGIGTTASFGSPYSVAVDGSGNVYVADGNNFDNGLIRKITAAGYTISAALPAGLTFDGTTGIISGTPLAAATAANYTITAYNPGGSSSTVLNLAVTGTATAPAQPTVPAISYATPPTYLVGTAITALTPTSSGGVIPALTYGQTTTFAGGAIANFNGPQAVATDIYGNVYVASVAANGPYTNGYFIKRITPSGTITILAGNGVNGFANGVGTAASFSTITGIAVDNSSNVYVVDQGNQVIRKITPAGVVSTFAGQVGVAGSSPGTGTAASFYNPSGIAVDKSGNVYVSELDNYDVRRITPAGVVSTLAGSGSSGYVNGTGTAASFGPLYSLTVDYAGNVYVADGTNGVIRKINSAALVTTFAGTGSQGFDDGTTTAASFAYYFYLAVNPNISGAPIFIADAGNNLIRRMTTAGVVTTIAGSGNAGFANGTGSAAGFNNPVGLAPDSYGNLYVADLGNNVIRDVYVAGYTTTTGFPAGLSLAGPTGVISGTPTTSSAAAAYTVTAYNAAGSATATINMTVLYPPSVTTSAPVTAFTSMGDITPVPVTVDNALTVSDLSRTTLASGTVSITGNFTSSQDVLGFTNVPATMGNIAGSYNSGTGVLSLTSSGSTATIAQWQAALASVTYDNTNNVSPTTASRTIAFTLSDGTYTSAVANKTVSITYTPSHNASLSNLTISTGTLTPAFAGTTTSYTVDFHNTTTAMTVTPTTASLNATVTVNGATVTSGSASASIPLAVGNTTITALVTAQDGTTQDPYTIVVTRAAAQTITFAATNSVTYGAADFAPGATSTNSTIPITYTSSNTAVATISGAGNIHVVGAGTTTITASQAGNVNYDAATSVSQTLTVTPAGLTVTAANTSKTYGSANPTFTATFTGFVNGDTQASLTTQPTYSTTASVTSPVGTYTVTPGGAADPNYTFSYVAGTLTVTTAQLYITANSVTKTYGTVLTGASGSTAFTSSGLQNSETISSVTIAYGTGAAGNAAVGTYGNSVTPSAATGGTFTASNYSISYSPGNITVTPAALTITANTVNKTYGTALTGSTGSTAFTPTGLQNSETIGSVTIAYGTGSAATAAAGTYTGTVTASAAVNGTFTASNYTISYAAGNIIVGKAALTITANSVTKIYGAVLTGASGSTAFVATGLKNSETVNSVTIAYGTGSAGNAAVGTYTGSVTPSAVTGGTFNASNYTITYATGNITVTPAPLTVTASTVTKTYGTVLTGAAGSTAFTSTGLQNSETIGSVTIAYGTGAAGNAAVGTYTGSVTPSAATSGTFTASNYTITYATGNIIVTPAALTITATTVNKTYGATLTGGSGSTAFTPTGLQNSETVGSVTIAYGTGAAANAAAGTYTGSVTASAAVNGTFTASNYTITYTSGNIIIGKAALTITANNATKIYGTVLTGAAGSMAFTSTGLQNSETIGSVTIAYGTGSAANAAVGTYTGSVTPSAATSGTFTASNYTITYTPGNIIVGAAALTITANNTNKTYGTALTGAAGSTAFTSSGLQNSETIGSVTIAYGTGAAGNAAVGTYTGSVTPSAATSGTFTASNYTITYATGNIIVGAAALTITANPVKKTYGTVLTGTAGSTAFTPTGLQNSETIGSVTIAYGTGSAANAAVGTYTGSVTPSAATSGTFTASNYTITYATGNIIVGAAALTITANTVNKTYGATLTGAAGSTAFTSAGLQNSETIGSVTIAYGTGSAANAAVGTYTGSVTPSAATSGTFTASNYTITYATGNIIVGAAALTITANNTNKTYGATLTGAAGSTAFTSSGLQNSETIGSVTIAYGTGAAGNAAVGTYTGSVTPSAATSGTFTASNYTITYATGNIIVGAAALTITANTVNKTYGATLTGASGSIAFTSTGLQNAETIGSVTIAYGTGSAANAAAGTYTGSVTASAAVNGTFTASNYTITYATGNIIVGAAALTITANTVNKTYGATLTGAAGSTAFTATGLQNSETIGSVTIAYGTGSAATAAVGTYTGSVTPSAATSGTFTASNYTITYATGNIIVGAAALTITANNTNKTYGATLTGASGSTAFTSSGLQNSETIGSVTIAYGTGAAGNAAVGTYTGSVTPSAATSGTFTASNYTITYATGNIIVGAAALTITANTVNKTYGATLTGASGSIAFTSTGLQNAETIGSVTIAYGTGSAANAAAGTYTGSVTASAAVNGTFTASNYTITYATGNIIVGAAALTITANTVNKTYGATLTGASGSTAFTATGLQNSETIGSVTIAYGTGSAATAAVGTYTGSVTPSAATSGTFTASNYTITYATGNIIVTSAALTITANNVNKPYGTTLTGSAGSTAFISTGLQNSQTIGSVTITYGTGAAASAAVGTYTGSVTASAATGGTFTATNYTITYQPGNIIVAGGPTLSYTSPQTYTAGVAITALTPTSSNVASLAYSSSPVILGSGFSSPSGVAVDAAGNLYVADKGNKEVKKIPAGNGTPVILGSGFNAPYGLTVDAAGDVYVADQGASAVYKIPAGNGTPVTIGSGFNAPTGVAIDAAGNLYIADYGNNKVKEIPAGSNTPVVIGSGFSEPVGVAVDASGNVYVGDRANNAVKEIPAGNGTPIVLGTGFNNPFGVAVDASGNVYVGDYNNNLVKMIPVGSSTPVAIGGTGFSHPDGVAVDGAGNVYVANVGNNAVNEIKPAGGFYISPFLPAGLAFNNTTGVLSGTATAAIPATTYTVTAYNAAGSGTATLSITVNSGIPSLSYTSPQTYLKGTAVTPLTPTSSGVTAVAYNSTPVVLGSGFSGPTGVAVDAAGNLYVADRGNKEVKKIPAGNGTPVILGSGFNSPYGLTVDAAGDVYVADYGANAVYKIPAGNGTPVTIGSGFNTPTGVAIDGAGNLYVADYGNNKVKEIPAGSNTPVVIGSGFSEPVGVAVDAAGNVYVGDRANNAVKKIPSGNGTPVILGSGFNNPFGVAVDASGNVYVGDYGNNLVKMIPVGSSTPVAIGGTGFSHPDGVAVDGAGNVYVADVANNAVKQIKPAGGFYIGPFLPVGLTFNNATGVISGTPTATSPATTYTVTGYDSFGSSTATVNITVNGPPSLSYASPQTYTAGTAITPLTPTSSGVAAVAYSSTPVILGSGFSGPTGVAVDAAGNLYVADRGNKEVKKIPAGNGTPVILGSGFNSPYGLTVDAAGDVYVADYGANAVYKIPAGNGTPVTIGSGFNTPTGVAVDAAGDLYIADYGNNKVKMIPAGSNTPVVIGSGFSEPVGVAVDASGNVYVGDRANNAVKEIPAGNGTPIVLGSGFNNPFGVAVDASGNVYVGDYGNNLVKMIPVGSSTPVSIGGTGFSHPDGVAADGAGNVYVADIANNAAKQIKPTGGFYIAPFLPAGLAFNNTTGVVSGTPTAPSSATTYTVTAYNSFGIGTATVNITVAPPLPTVSYTSPQTYTQNTAITPLTPTSSNVAAVAYSSTPVVLGSGFSGPTGVAVDAAGNLYVADKGNKEVKKIPAGNGTAVILGSGFNTPYGVAVDAAGDVYVADQGANAVYKIPAGNGTPVTIGSGFNAPTGVAIDAAGNLYVADYGNNKVKMILAGSNTPVVIGSGFSEPVGVAVDASGNVYVGDRANNAVKEIPAGNGTPVVLGSGFNNPFGVAVDASGNVYVGDYGNNLVKMIPVGSSTPVAIGGTGFSHPDGVAADGAGNVYVANVGNNAVNQVKPAGGFYIGPFLPAGLAFNNTTGIISGTPAAASPATTYTVTAYNGFGKSTAALSIAVLSNNASLAGLVLSSGPLSPVFATGTTSYTASVANTVSSVTVTPTTSVSTATVTVNGTAVTSGTASQGLPLVQGANTITVLITAQSGATETYTITVTQAAGSGAFRPPVNPTDSLANDGILVHQGVSPNGDGINDFLVIEGITNYPDNHLMIINRNGALIYQANGYDNTKGVFDGHSNINGKMQAPGTYFYVLDYNVNGVTKHKTGYIVLKY